MKIGDIIRRKGPLGDQRGPYMTITHVDDEWIYAIGVNSEMPDHMVLKRNVHVCTNISIACAHTVIGEIRDGKKIAISHPISKRWVSIWRKKPELITFFSPLMGDKVTIVVDEISQYGNRIKIFIKCTLL